MGDVGIAYVATRRSTTEEGNLHMPSHRYEIHQADRFMSRVVRRIETVAPGCPVTRAYHTPHTPQTPISGLSQESPQLFWLIPNRAPYFISYGTVQHPTTSAHLLRSSNSCLTPLHSENSPLRASCIACSTNLYCRLTHTTCYRHSAVSLLIVHAPLWLLPLP
jgi:hypothetical protein